MASSYSQRQWRAIRRYADKEGMIPQLSAFPHVRFKARSTNEIITLHITVLEDWYDADKKRKTIEDKQR